LAQDGSGNQYAMKKIRCTLGTEEADLAQKEVDIYQLFSHKNIIKMVVRIFLFFIKMYYIK
jgi:serine/threonine kinase 16